MISKKVNFDPILTRKRAILPPILCFRGKITKLSPEMDSLAPKTYIQRGHTCFLAQYSILKDFLKIVKIQNGRHFEIALEPFSTTFERADKFFQIIQTLTMGKKLVCNVIKGGGGAGVTVASGLYGITFPIIQDYVTKIM